ncbi:MAG: twitching motility protein [Microgenomates group bacterium GW2011_GWA1_Microgenomates_45_10]|nr:MAG: twitching motility protein [Microgenomates group bacterium GW2011_GWA2_44_7]KKT87487.1 MAG: twitching motility protein [Microgenomates group bacterium GW2011_GWA1_Microgenomates_45_10]
MEIKQLLSQAIQKRASDLHLVTGIHPTLRIDGTLFSLTEHPILDGVLIEGLIKDVTNDEQREILTVNRELDFSVGFGDQARFRVNAYYQKSSLAASFRWIPTEIPSVDSLGLPPICHQLAQLRQGLILFTGPTGHGKSTSMASIIAEILNNRGVHVVTIEDPVEFTFIHSKGIVSQREMHGDTHSWAVALRSVLREDPDVVLVGEMRDYETISATLTIAETGHLVFATLHTNSAAQSVDRIVDVFPEQQQAQVRMQLSGTLEAIISQRLMPQISGRRTLAYEIMLGTTAIKTVVREGKTHLIDNIIQTSSEAGMAPLEVSLAQLIRDGKITYETGREFAIRPDELTRLVNR